MGLGEGLDGAKVGWCTTEGKTWGHGIEWLGVRDYVPCPPSQAEERGEEDERRRIGGKSEQQRRV